MGGAFAPPVNNARETLEMSRHILAKKQFVLLVGDSKGQTTVLAKSPEVPYGEQLQMLRSMNDNGGELDGKKYTSGAIFGGGLCRKSTKLGKKAPSEPQPMTEAQKATQKKQKELGKKMAARREKYRADVIASVKEQRKANAKRNRPFLGNKPKPEPQPEKK